MKFIKNHKHYFDWNISIRQLEDLSSITNLESLIKLISSLEIETGESYKLLRMQQINLEIYGIYPQSYDPRSRSLVILNSYSKEDLNRMRLNL